MKNFIAFIFSLLLASQAHALDMYDNIPFDSDYRESEQSSRDITSSQSAVKRSKINSQKESRFYNFRIESVGRIPEIEEVLEARCSKQFRGTIISSFSDYSYYAYATNGYRVESYQNWIIECEVEMPVKLPLFSLNTFVSKNIQGLYYARHNYYVPNMTSLNPSNEALALHFAKANPESCTANSLKSFSQLEKDPEIQAMVKEVEKSSGSFSIMTSSNTWKNNIETLDIVDSDYKRVQSLELTASKENGCILDKASVLQLLNNYKKQMGTKKHASPGITEDSESTVVSTQ